MKLPAIRAQIGIWVYYISVLSFDDINKYVKRVDDELHKSKLLREMLQRSITENYKSISEYIKTQDERFFNALILAVYDGDPEWHEVRLEYDDGEEFVDLGILELTGKEKIFPVDGQHRVEGIKHALIGNSQLATEKVPVVFVGHKKDDEGMQRTRRMFSTLNRYAKPVSMRDIIALDEDDIVAIASRDLIDNNILFEDNRILDSKTKAIPDNNTSAFTTIITFYECNRELLWFIINDMEIVDLEGRRIRGSSKIKYFIRHRPSDDIIEKFFALCNEYWKSVLEMFPDYVKSDPPNVGIFRNKEGGNLIFRPVSLIPFTKAVVRISLETGKTFDEIFAAFNKELLYIQHPIWKNVIWNSEQRVMVMNHQKLIELMIIYIYDKALLSDTEYNKLMRDWSDIRQIYEKETIGSVIDELIEGDF